MNAATPQDIRARQRASEMYNAQFMIRLMDPTTGKYLHLSGHGVAGIGQSWLGYQEQAKNLRQKALARGEDWPWVAVERGDM